MIRRLGFTLRLTRGFTLIELLVVLSIIGIAASLIGPVAIQQYERTKVTEEREQMLRLLNELQFQAYTEFKRIHLTTNGSQMTIYGASIDSFDDTKSSFDTKTGSRNATKVSNGTFVASKNDKIGSNETNGGSIESNKGSIKSIRGSNEPKKGSNDTYESSNNTIIINMEFIEFKKASYDINSHGWWSKESFSWFEGSNERVVQLNMPRIESGEGEVTNAAPE